MGSEMCIRDRYVRFACDRSHFPMLVMYWAEATAALLSYLAGASSDLAGHSKVLRNMLLSGRVQVVVQFFTNYGSYPYVALFLVNFALESTEVHWRIFMTMKYLHIGDTCMTWLLIILVRGWQIFPLVFVAPAIVTAIVVNLYKQGRDTAIAYGLTS